MFLPLVFPMGRLKELCIYLSKLNKISLVSDHKKERMSYALVRKFNDLFRQFERKIVVFWQCGPLSLWDL